MPVELCAHAYEPEEGLLQLVEMDAGLLLEAAGLAESELSLVLTDDAGIQALNGAWRDKDKATDVLSFPQDLPGLLGDLVMSVETAKRQCGERGHSLRDELRILMVHGLLHLCGEDHEASDAAYARMAERERVLLSQLGWAGRGLIDLAEQGEAGH